MIAIRLCMIERVCEREGPDAEGKAVCPQLIEK